MNLIAANPGYWARTRTPRGEEDSYRVVGWALTEDGYGWPVVEQPSMHDNCPAVIHVLALQEEHGWTYLGTDYREPTEVIPALPGWHAMFDAADQAALVDVEVVAWEWNGVASTPLIMSPHHEESDESLVRADAFNSACGWRLEAVTRDPGGWRREQEELVARLATEDGK